MATLVVFGRDGDTRFAELACSMGRINVDLYDVTRPEGEWNKRPDRVMLRDVTALPALIVDDVVFSGLADIHRAMRVGMIVGVN